MRGDHGRRIRSDEARNALRDIVVRVDDFPFDYGVATANKPAESRMAA
jgi:acyl-CoA dehydrogenase